MRNGFLRFGTLEEYRQAEGGEHRLSDTSEGTWGYRPAGDLVNYTGALPFGFATNSSFILGEASALFAHSVDCHVFCTTRGQHVAATLLALQERGNASLDSYVTFNRACFEKALTDFFQEVLGPGAFWRDRVSYLPVEKRTIVDVDNIAKIPRDMPIAEMRRAIFSKSSRFEHEKEFRFAVFARDHHEIRPIFVRESAPSFAVRFANCVVAHGQPT